MTAINNSEGNIQTLTFKKVKILTQQKNKNNVRKGMRRTLTSKKYSSVELLTLFTCEEEKYIFLIMSKIFFKNADSVGKFILRFSDFVQSTVL